MKVKSLLSIAALALMANSSAWAVPIHYEGAITTNAPNGPAIPVTGSVGGFSIFDDDPSGVDFWSFSALAGQNIFVRVVRLASALDPIAYLYSGTTTADVSAWPSIRDLSIGQSFGGLTLIAFNDDALAPPNNLGPAGDPFFVIRAPVTGLYTLLVAGIGSDADPAGGLPYRATVAVPLPATLPLVLLALGSLGWTLRRRG